MKLLFTAEQCDLVKRIGIPFDISSEMSDDELCQMEEKIGDHLTLHCLGRDYRPNRDGEICQDILEKLSRIE